MVWYPVKFLFCIVLSILQPLLFASDSIMWMGVFSIIVCLPAQLSHLIGIQLVDFKLFCSNKSVRWIWIPSPLLFTNLVLWLFDIYVVYCIQQFSIILKYICRIIFQNWHFYWLHSSVMNEDNQEHCALL